MSISISISISKSFSQSFFTALLLTHSVCPQFNPAPAASNSSIADNLKAIPGFGLSPPSSTNSGFSPNLTNSSIPSISNDWNPLADPNPGTNARIPQSISTTCQTYLARLNTNPSIQACTAPLLNATASFAGGPQTVKPAQVKAAFDGLCGPSSGAGCAPSMMQHVLNHLAGNCSAELQSGVSVVRMTYDVLYILTPYRVALCAKDPNTGGYCPSEIATAVVNGSAEGKKETKKDAKTMSATDFGALVTSVFGDKLVTQLGNSQAAAPHPPVLQTRAMHNASHQATLLAALAENNATTAGGASPNAVYHPNTETYTTTNLAFLFLSPDLPDAVLCKPCTQAVLAAYIGFEQATPHVGGLSSSGYLSGQVKLWQAVHSRCGAAFSEAIDQEAGIMSVLTNSGAQALKLLQGQWASLVVGGVALLLIKSLSI